MESPQALPSFAAQLSYLEVEPIPRPSDYAFG